DATVLFVLPQSCGCRRYPLHAGPNGRTAGVMKEARFRIERDAKRNELAIRDARIIRRDDLDPPQKREKKQEDHPSFSRKRAAASRNSSLHSWPPSYTQVITCVMVRRNFKSFSNFSAVYQSSR